MKIASFGPLPPHWGGPVSGGIATYHAALLEAFGGDSGTVREVSIFTNRRMVVTDRLPDYCTLNPTKSGDVSPDCLRDIVATHDVLLVHHLSNPWADILVDRGAGAKMVCVVHSWTALLEDPRIKDRLQRNMDASEALVFPSHLSITQGRNLGMRVPQEAHVVYGPLGPEFRSPVSKPSVRSGLLFAGSLLEVKRCEIFIEAMALLPAGITATVAGDGPLRQHLEALAASLGLSGRMTFAGDLSSDDLRGAYRTGSLLCVPSLSESMGLVYVEALSQGMPIVGYAPSVRELCDMIGTDCGLGFSGSTAEELAQTLMRALSMTVDRDKISATVRQRFAPEVSSASLEEVLRKFHRAPLMPKTGGI